MKTPSGLINQKIEIYSDQDTPNSSGGVNPNSALYWATTAETKPVTVRRQDQMGVTIFEAAMQFTVRDRIDKNVLENMLLKYRGVFYTIVSSVPDYVYNEFLVIKAVTSTPPLRTVPQMGTIKWGFLPIDYFGDEGSIPVLPFSQEVSFGASSISLDFTSAASGFYLAVQFPDGWTPDYNYWTLDVNNSDNIPGFNWHPKQSDYLLSKEIFYLNEGNTTITFSNV